MRRLFLLLMLPLVASTARAQAYGCPEDRSIPELKDCLNAVFARADRDLNQAYQAARASIDRATHMPVAERNAWKQALRTAQRAWVTFKEIDCGVSVPFMYYGSAGSGIGVGVTSCLIEHTRIRTRELRESYGQ
jgi:uncharacterized protein YecT (DUF1311 family)